LAVLAKAVSVAARADRIVAMLSRELRVSRGVVARYVLCGFAADNVIASTAGVAARTYLLVRHGGARLRSVLGAAALEKYLDGVMMGLGLEVVVHYRLLPLPWAEPAYLGVFGLGLAFLVAALALARGARGTRLGRWLAPAADALGGPAQATRSIAATLVVWTFEALVLTCTMRAIGLGFGLRETLVLTTVGTLAFVLPGLPSGVGTFEVGVVFGLRALGVDGGRALGAALLLHAMQVLPETAAGLYAFRSLGVRARAARVEGLPAEPAPQGVA
jgi:uncharacterized membrane protein YbhN (UPF0104 family)